MFVLDRMHAQGYAPITINLTARVTEIVENSYIKEEWFEGDLVGTGEWTLEPYNGKTLVRFHMKVRPNRLLITFLSKFVNSKKIFLRVMESAFKGLQKIF